MLASVDREVQVRDCQARKHRALHRFTAGGEELRGWASGLGFWVPEFLAPAIWWPVKVPGLPLGRETVAPASLILGHWGFPEA